MNYFDLHRHDEASTFDGFGKPEQLAKTAKSLGYKALGISNHGTTNTLVRHYYACKENDIKPILGVECYFLPKFDPEKKRRGYHLCLFAKNANGYSNLCTLLSEAEHNKYYNPIVTFELLRKYGKDIICSTACISGPLSRNVEKGKSNTAEKLLHNFIAIFRDDLYIEIQPYKIDALRTQQRVNEELMNMAERYNVKCILTSDSHYGSKEDFPTYLKMHEISKHNMEHIRETYKARYMPSEDAISRRFLKMHPDYEYELENMLFNLNYLQESVSDNIFEEMKIELPIYNENKDSFETIIKHVAKGLKRRGKYNNKYIDRAKEELKVIKNHGFEDYFLIVEDYMKFARKNDITVGPGRGSGCNSIINYALGITDVDSIKYDLYFGRFLRIDKQKLPDIDIDFETARRHEMIEYMQNKYGNQVAQVGSYGLFKEDSLIRDLFKVCGVPVPEHGKLDFMKQLVKKITKKYRDEDGEIDFEELLCDPKVNEFNDEYDNFFIHFAKMYNHLRYIGTHAAGVVLSKDPINKYVHIKINKEGNHTTAYDLYDLERIGIVKFDFLGLSTLEQIRDLREHAGGVFDDDKFVSDTEVLEAFREGKTDGIFQYGKQAAKDILINIEADCFEDVCAASAMNRPVPLSLGIPEQYAENKMNKDAIDESLPWSDLIKDTYGTILYQEQIQSIALNIGQMDGPDADRMMKMSPAGNKAYRLNYEKYYDGFWDKFKKGAKAHKIPQDQARDMFDRFFAYSFNKGHSVGYCLISFEQMYYKVHYPTEYWATLLRYENDDTKRRAFEVCAAKEGVVIIPAHINGPSGYEVVLWGGGKCIQRGISMLKGIGVKAAEEIDSKGPFLDRADFEEKVEKRTCNKRVLDALEAAGAFEFNEIIWKHRIRDEGKKLFNSSLVVR